MTMSWLENFQPISWWKVWAPASLALRLIS